MREKKKKEMKDKEVVCGSKIVQLRKFIVRSNRNKDQKMKTVDLYDKEEEETVSDDGEVVIDLFEPEAIDLSKKKPNFLEILK